MRLLIVGTLGGQLTVATKLAMDKGASVTHAESNEQALAVLRSGRGADLLMADVSLDIRDLVARLDAERIHVPIVACGVTNDARAAVNAIHAGAKEYIPLPPDPDLIAAVLAAVADDTREMIYRDDAMAKVIKLAQQIAGSDASVLITGESGTGKEVLARHVHARSRRAMKPFITVNCAAIPENLHRAVLLSTGPEIGLDGILTPEGTRLDAVHSTGAAAQAAIAAEQVTRNLVGRTVAEVERDLILETLKHCLGNRTHAANILGISIRTLRNKLNEYAAGGTPIPPPHGGEALRGAA